jgi:hypothetical protein
LLGRDKGKVFGGDNLIGVDVVADDIAMAVEGSVGGGGGGGGGRGAWDGEKLVRWGVGG